jgi:outer membrane protein OmpA-like peptidoglycan-associated protein
MIRIKLVFIFLLLNILAFAQKEYTSSVPNAVRYYEAAIRLYNGRMDKKALEALNEAIKADPNFVEAHLLKAQIYFDFDDAEKAMQSYKDAIAINPDFFPASYYYIGACQFYMGNYAEAKEYTQKFLDHPKSTGILKEKAKHITASCDFAVEAMKHPVPFDPKSLGDSINTSDDEYFPSITADGKTLLFTRKMHSYNEQGKHIQQEDLFLSTMTTKGWSRPVPVSDLNTPGNEGAAVLSPDGRYLFMVACNDEREVEGARKTHGSCDIFLSRKSGNSFSPPRNLEDPINTSLKESMPSFSSDGRTLYFVRRFVTDRGFQHDIMVSHIGDNSEWSIPQSVGDSINTDGDEIGVFIHPDNKTLYFASNGHPGFGGYDIFVSRLDSNGVWGKPENMGYPINTSKNEETFLVSPDGKTAYFSSTRMNGKGGEDLYQFSLYEQAQPVPVSYMKGIVYDADTKKPLATHFDLIDLSTGKVAVSSASDETNGSYLVSLPTGKRYALNASKDNYLFYSDNFELKESHSAEPFIKDVAMMPIKAGESIVLKNIFYETDKFDLKKESMIELDRLVAFLNKNPKVNFEISGHTDNVGTKAYNQTLSEKRAKSVYDYLLSKGISAARMSSKGYGDTKPVAENTTDKGRSQNRRTEFMITSAN